MPMLRVNPDVVGNIPRGQFPLSCMRIIRKRSLEDPRTDAEQITVAGQRAANDTVELVGDA